MPILCPCRRVSTGLILTAVVLGSSPLSTGLLAQVPSGDLPTSDGPLSPGESLAAFRAQPGLRVELVAAEPMVVSPVACAFDARGRLYVVENRGYPTGPGPGQPPAGRIALLEDRDGDGRMDHRDEFVEGLTFPNGVMPWNGGVIVTCAPDVLWLRDRDGDGRADERQVLFTGFSTQGSTQLRVSHPTLSPDNWIYLTSGLTGGSVTSPEHPAHPAVALGRADFRFRPDRRVFEGADGGSQFGMTFDDFGHRFICYNRVQVQHVVMSTATLRRNPHLAFSETVENCPAEMTPEPLKGHGAAARLYPISRNVTTADSHAGTFTAACAVTVFRGDGLPDAYRGGVFSCDPTGNLVHFDRLEPAGATFRARPPVAGVEFLASTDNWMRPVFLASGPDGALYICDMYRKTIEHPDYLPVEVRKRTDFEGGKTMGRIWRVVRDDVEAGDLRRRRRVDLEGAAATDLCAVILDRDGWHRDTAHRLLLERGGLAARSPLSAIAGDPASGPASVVLALWMLEATEGLTDEVLHRALIHPAAGVRENALRIAEVRPRTGPSWRDLMLRLVDDPDARVRFQAAIALGNLPVARGQSDPVTAALARVATRDGRDRWMRAAIFSSLSGREASFVEALRKQAGGGKWLAPELLTELGRMAALAIDREGWPSLLRLIVAGQPGDAFTLTDQAALLSGLAGSMRGKLAPAHSDDLLEAMAAGDEGLATSIQAVVKAMEATARDPAAEIDRRREAVGLLAFAGFGKVGETLLSLVAPGQPAALQVAAVRALGTQRDPAVARALLSSERFGGSTPAVRDEILAALLDQSAQVPGVLDAVADGRIPVGSVDALRRRQLSQHPDPRIRQRAEALFGAIASDRAKVYESYKDVIRLVPDPARGRTVFRRECAQCHRLDQEGTAVGPDLFGIRNQPKEAILLHILVPDHELTPGYTAYSVATEDGRVLTGLLVSETPSTITLRQALGKEDTIPRDQAAEMSASRQSLMPQGLEKSITRQEFADLLAYLKGEATGSR